MEEKFSPSRTIVDKLKKNHIVPESKLKLNWKNYIFWMVLVLMIILGIIFFSFMLLGTFDVGMEAMRYFHLMRFIKIFIMSAPLIWIALCVGVLFFGIMAFRKTKRGYRYNILFIVSVVVLIVSILGTVSHFTRINDRLSGFARRGMLKNFGKIDPLGGNRFENSEEGILVGKIEDINDDNFMLISVSEKIWKVFYNDKTKKCVELERGTEIIVFGEMINEESFNARGFRDFPIIKKGCKKYNEK